MSAVVVFFWFYSLNSQLMAEIDVFLTHKTKNKNKIEKYEDFSCRLEKLASSLKINITKMGKMHKSEKFIIIFVLQSRFQWKLS